MKGIMFKPDMHQAVIEGKKTQTRRTGGLDLVNEAPDINFFNRWEKDPEVVKRDKNGDFTDEIKISQGWHAEFIMLRSLFEKIYFRPRYQPGDIVYLKEPYDVSDDHFKSVIYKYDGDNNLLDQCFDHKYRNKMFMPAKYARHFIEIITAGPERLQDISEYDAHWEGIEYYFFPDDKNKPSYYFYPCNDIRDDSYLDSPITSFYSLWKSINGQKSWDTNPWVWVYKFKYLENINNLAEANSLLNTYNS